MSSQLKSRGQARPVGRPPGPASDDTRSAILDAALDAFAESGFEAMSVRHLTRRLEVSHNLVHHHFGSKEDLWRAALEHGLGPTTRELLELLGSSAGSSKPREVLQQGIEQAVALLMRRPAVVRIVVQEAAHEGARLDHLHEAYLEPMIDALRRFLAKASGKGVRNIDPRVAALFVLSTASAQFSLRALAGKLGLRDAAEGGYSDVLVELMLGGLMQSDPEPTA